MEDVFNHSKSDINNRITRRRRSRRREQRPHSLHPGRCPSVPMYEFTGLHDSLVMSQVMRWRQGEVATRTGLVSARGRGSTRAGRLGVRAPDRALAPRTRRTKTPGRDHRPTVWTWVRYSFLPKSEGTSLALKRRGCCKISTKPIEV